METPITLCFQWVFVRINFFFIKEMKCKAIFSSVFCPFLVKDMKKVVFLCVLVVQPGFQMKTANLQQ